MKKITMKQFRGYYQNMIDPKRKRFVIKRDSDDSWILITTISLSNIAVWHKPLKGEVDLALWAQSKDAVGDAIPPNCKDVSTAKTRQFRWHVSKVDPTESPINQEGVAQAIKIARQAFDWVRHNRV